MLVSGRLIFDMRLKALFLHFLLCCCVVCNAQISDSLYKALPAAIQPKNKNAITDKERADIISNIPVHVIKQYQEEIDAMIAYIDNKAAVTKDRHIKVVYTSDIAGYYVNINRYDKAQDYYLKVIWYAGKDTAYNKEVAEAGAQLAALYTLQTETDSAMTYLHMALDVGNKKDTSFMSKIYTAYQLVYGQLSMYDSAIYYAKKSVCMMPVSDTWYQNYTFCYFEIGGLYAAFFKQTHEKKYADSAYYYAGNIMAKTKDDREGWYSSCYCLMGTVKYLEKEYAAAIPYLDSCLRPEYVKKSIGVESIPVCARLLKAMSQVKLGINKVAALKLLDTIHLADRDFFLLQGKNEVLYQDAEAAGNWKAALKYYKKYVEFTDSLGFIDNKSKIFEANQKYSVAKKQAVITDLENKSLLQEKQESRIKSIAGIVALMLLLAVISVYTFFKRNQLKEAKEKQQLSETLNKVENDFNNERLQLQEEQIRQIKAQRYEISTDVHDGINSGLAALKYYVSDLKRTSTDVKTQGLLDNIESELQSLYLLARDFLHKLSTEKVDVDYSVVYLLDSLKEQFDFISILKINTSFSEKELEGRLNPLQQKHLCMVIQEAVANIVKYAQAQTVNISIHTDGSNCVFTIRDDGKGFDVAAAGKGLGLQSMENRITTLHGTLSITSGKSGTTIRGQFPIS